MERLENQSLNNSCKTLNLKTSDIFISSYPGKIIFGTITKNNYCAFSYFQFLTFELFYLYVSLIAIIKAFANESELTRNKIILKVNEELSYLWSIVTVKVLNEEKKYIEIILQHCTNETYKVLFNIDELKKL